MYQTGIIYWHVCKFVTLSTLFKVLCKKSLIWIVIWKHDHYNPIRNKYFSPLDPKSSSCSFVLMHLLHSSLLSNAFWSVVLSLITFWLKFACNHWYTFQLLTDPYLYFRFKTCMQCFICITHSARKESNQFDEKQSRYQTL